MSIDAEFTPFPKIARLNRDIVVTEKIDGTNAAINIRTDEDGFTYATAQSRNRVITPESDNYGFARWVYDNLEELFATLGDGLHFGEWWGSGIQRRYGLTGDDKRFSLFNTSRWEGTDLSAVPGLGVVPVLYAGPFDSSIVDACVSSLALFGSVASPGFADPEGVVVYHTAARTMFKVTVKDDAVPKALSARAAA